MRKITIRIDDIAPGVNWEKYDRLEEMLDKRQIAPLIGVIPCVRDTSLIGSKEREDYAQWLQKKMKQGWVIAMHGCYHLYTTQKGGLFPLNHFSEFSGLSYEEQKTLITEGLEALKQIGITTDIFMAPGHSFDKVTLKVLKEKGFRYVTDGFGKTPYLRGNLIFLPIAARRKKDIEKKDGMTTVVYHPQTMTEKEFKEAETFFDRYGDQIVDYKTWFEIEAPKRNACIAAGEYLEATAKHMISSIRAPKG